MSQVNVDRRARARTPAPRPYWRLVVSALCISGPVVMLLCLVLPFLVGGPEDVPHGWIVPGIVLGAALFGGLIAVTAVRTR